MAIATPQYVRCFWSGSLYLTNGIVMPIHCKNISSNMVEVEAPTGLQGSKLVKLELKAIHEGKTAFIKILCDPSLDILNEHDKHTMKLKFHTITEKDANFIRTYINDKA